MTQKVNQATGQLDQVSGDWPMLDALVGGTAAMRKAGKTFLPQWPNEDDDSYKSRLASATLHPAFKRTCGVMAAKPFSRAISIDDIPATVEALLDDIDMQGTTLTAFAFAMMFKCLSHGMVGALVEYPRADGVKTVADEKAAGVRPYVVTYEAKSILGWRVDRKGLRLLRLLETVTEEEGDYSVKSVEQVRVLRPGSWEIWRPDTKKPDDWILHDEGKTTLSVIPFVFFYGTRLAYGVGQSPLLDLAFQNVEHYQSASDQQTILHVSRVPILFAKCFGDSTITIGASSAASTDHPEASLSYVEHSGAAIEAGRQALLDLEDRMRATGAELISNKPSSKITATQIRSEDDGNKSTLQQIVEMFEESMESVLNLMAAWTGGEQTAEVEMFKDFNATSDTDPVTLTNAESAGIISKQTAFEELQRRDIISHERTWDAEQQLLNAQPQPTA